MAAMLPKVLLMGIYECGVDILSDMVSFMTPLRSGNWLNQWEEDVSASLMTMKQGQYRPGYVYYSADVKRFLDDNQIRRLFIYKDPRDMIVTYLLYILNNSTHAHNKYFTEHLKSTDQRLMKLISGFHESRKVARDYGLVELGYGNVNDYFNRYLRWLDDPNTCVIRYEDLIDGTTKLHKEMNRIVDYLWKDLKPISITNTDAQLFSSVQLSGKLIGGWKKYFTDEIKDQFKNVAGDLLIYLGYENDFNW